MGNKQDFPRGSRTGHRFLVPVGFCAPIYRHMCSNIAICTNIGGIFYGQVCAHEFWIHQMLMTGMHGLEAFAGQVRRIKNKSFAARDSVNGVMNTLARNYNNLTNSWYILKKSKIWENRMKNEKGSELDQKGESNWQLCKKNSQIIIIATCYTTIGAIIGGFDHLIITHSRD